MDRMLGVLSGNIIVFDNTIFRRFFVFACYKSSIAEGVTVGMEVWVLVCNLFRTAAIPFA
jgi:hypothetical protein